MFYLMNRTGRALLALTALSLTITLVPIFLDVTGSDIIVVYGAGVSCLFGGTLFIHGALLPLRTGEANQEMFGFTLGRWGEKGFQRVVIRAAAVGQFLLGMISVVAGLLVVFS